MRADTNFVELLDANPWLKTTRLVVKPDMLFGKRGKHDLVRRGLACWAARKLPTGDLCARCLGLLGCKWLTACRCQVGLNLDFAGVEAFIKARMGKVIDMNGCVGAINTFIVEPFVPHDQEYYLCMQVCALLPVSAAECSPFSAPAPRSTASFSGGENRQALPLAKQEQGQYVETFCATQSKRLQQLSPVRLPCGSRCGWATS